MADLKDLKALLDDIANSLISRRDLNKYALAIIRIIRDRTRKGIFLEGSTPGSSEYSEGHARRRELAGLPTNIVNLEFDKIDGMLHQIDHVVFADNSGAEVDIYDEQKRRIGYYHHTSGAGRRRVIRKWFDLNDEEEKKIFDLVANDVQVRISDLVSQHS